MTFIKRFSFFRFIILFSAFAAIELNAAQVLESDQVKAAYIYNFLKHVNWPSEQQKSNFTIAVYKDASYGELLKLMLNSRKVKGKDIRIVSIANLQDAQQFEVVYIPQRENANIAMIASSLRSSETLLITDGSADQHNVMINILFNEKSSALSFEVNKSNIVYEGLSVSDELLLLGGTELDVATLYRKTEQAMQKTLQREHELNDTLVKLQGQLSLSRTSLQQLDQELEKNSVALSTYKNESKKLKIHVQKQQVSLAQKEQQLAGVKVEFERISHQLAMQKKELVAKEIEKKEMSAAVDRNREILMLQRTNIERQQKDIVEHQAKLEQQGQTLKVRDRTIDEQQSYINLTIIIIVFISVIMILIVYLFFKNRRTTYKLSETVAYLEETQTQLIQSEKLAALGQLTAGVAHEINTPLGVAVTSTSALLEKTEVIEGKFKAGSISKSFMSSYFDDVNQALMLNTRALERVINLLQNFKQVAADQIVEEPREINLSDYLEEIMSTLLIEIKRHHIKYEYNGEPELIFVTVPGALAQVITNLITNSLRHGFENRDSGNIQINTSSNEKGVVIAYRDNGHGMSSEVLSHIFEPFFTTKRNQGGTGLGMNIVYNVINQKLNGNIEIESAPEQGVTITICLPFSLEQ